MNEPNTAAPLPRRLSESEVQASLARSRSRLTAALAAPCVEHDAEPGEFCWDDPASTVRGLCLPRYEAGVRGALVGGSAAVLRDPSPSGAQAASATAAAHAEAARLRLERRHPNRHPVRPPRAEAVR
ncbi:MAG TPA: hypothetical protein VGM45_08795 [Gaiellaceae bacterium]|jgi:hypothetical protein